MKIRKNNLPFSFSKKGYGCKWTWETIQVYAWMQVKVKDSTFNAVVTIIAQIKIDSDIFPTCVDYFVPVDNARWKHFG